ncbi:MAG: MjaI family restriction endonuclease [Lewinellaceae bacterium]|nr:MjaI family restriction endonuclease [Lewinellaceae bacterium]
MAYTGGDLNLLNGKYGISAPHRSVPVMKLIQAHRPKSRDELCGLIQDHFYHDCPCGIKSKGTVQDFGKNLYQAQQAEWGEYRYSLQACVQWEYDLFVVQSLKGTVVEEKALSYFQKNLGCVGLSAIRAEGFLDEELRVDLVIEKEGRELCGIQVKPLTFNRMREGVQKFNKAANIKWGKPVFYLFYDEREHLVNTEAVVAAVLETLR